METLKINIPAGFEIDTFNKETGEVSFKPKLPKYPTDISQIPLPSPSYFINTVWEIKSNNFRALRDREFLSCRRNLARKEDAEALVALAELITLRDEYNRISGYNNSENAHWYSIVCSVDKSGYELEIRYYDTIMRVLSFAKNETAQTFLKNFRPLIEKAKLLI